jgi:molybdopterin/thiamine biosynthesis adenylyltransferase
LHEKLCRIIDIKLGMMQVVAHTQGFLPGNALQLAEQYDVVVDASDNAATRYLISDVCCVLGLPLVSGAAIGTDGQLTVYCHGDGDSIASTLCPGDVKLFMRMRSKVCLSGHGVLMSVAHRGEGRSATSQRAGRYGRGMKLKALPRWS